MAALRLESHIARRPSVPGQVDISWSSAPLHQCSKEAFLSILSYARAQAQALLALQQNTRDASVGRIGLLYDGVSTCLRLTPLANTRAEWKPMLVPATRYSERDPGFVDTASGPFAGQDLLDRWQSTLGFDEPIDASFLGSDSHDGLFARIVRGKEQHWRIYQDAHSVAFFTPFANGPFGGLVVPRKPLPSDVFSLSADEYTTLLESVHAVVALLLARTQATGVGLAFEGMEINYTHVKLYPRFATSAHTHPPVLTCSPYNGMLSSLPGPELPYESWQSQEEVWQAVLPPEN
ncbi:unnamed protein product [Parajaminaea phylloscopi]